MNEKEVGELRRRLRPEKNSITHIRGCYVNEMGESVAQFDQSLALMTQEETETLLALLRRTLSGTLGKNLLDLSFETRQVVEGEEHRRLMRLRDTALQDEEAVEEFFQLVRQSLTLEGNYLILLVYDRYDVPYRAKDGERQEDAAAEVYSYLLCSICPVKQTKPALSYHVRENEFHNRRADWLVSPPELGFLFPAFDDRSTNLYNALYYTRDSGEYHPELVEAVFRREAPLPAAAQKETFQTLLSDTLADECSCEVVQAVHDQLCELVEEHRDVSQGELALGFRTGGLTCWEEEYPALVMCNAIFGGTPLSKLFLNVREKLSLCYYASSMLEKMKGLVLVSSGIEFDKYQQARDEILAQLEAIRRGEIEDWELEGARRALLSGHLSTRDDQGRLEEFWLGQAAAGLDTGVEELAERFASITREQVAAAAQRLELDTVYFLNGQED